MKHGIGMTNQFKLAIGPFRDSILLFASRHQNTRWSELRKKIIIHVMSSLAWTLKGKIDHMISVCMKKKEKWNKLEKGLLMLCNLSCSFILHRNFILVENKHMTSPSEVMWLFLRMASGLNSIVLNFVSEWIDFGGAVTILPPSVQASEGTEHQPI